MGWKTYFFFEKYVRENAVLTLAKVFLWCFVYGLFVDKTRTDHMPTPKNITRICNNNTCCAKCGSILLQAQTERKL